MGIEIAKSGDARHIASYWVGALRYRANLGFALTCLGSLIAFIGLYCWRLDQVPPYLNNDEAGLGLSSYLLATTGRDYFGNLLPTYVRYYDHGELGNPILCYWAIPFVATLGLSPVSIRLAMVVAGFISVLLLVFLSWQVSRNRWVSLAGAGMLALSPLFFIHSRMFMEPILTVPFITGWLIFMVAAETSRDTRCLLMAAIVLGIGSYVYSTTRMLMPIYLGLTLLVFQFSGRCSWKTSLKALALFGLCLIPMLLFALQNMELFGARFREISWLTRGGAIPKDPFNIFVAHYLAQLDPVDLFLTGDRSLVHSTGQAGVFLRSTIPLAIVGLIAIGMRLRRRNSPFLLVLLLALLLFPLPTALLIETHRPYRSPQLLPMYLITCVMGLQFIVSRYWRKPIAKAIVVGIAALLTIEALPFFLDYYNEYPRRAVAADYFNGNKPKAFSTVFEMAETEFYFDREDSLDSTFAQFFKISNGHRGSIKMVEPKDRENVPSGSLLVTRRQDKYLDLFEEEVSIPEIAESFRGHYSILRRR